MARSTRKTRSSTAVAVARDATEPGVRTATGQSSRGAVQARLEAASDSKEGIAKLEEPSSAEAGPSNTAPFQMQLPPPPPSLASIQRPAFMNALGPQLQQPQPSSFSDHMSAALAQPPLATMSRSARNAQLGLGSKALQDWQYCGVFRWIHGAADETPLSGPEVIEETRVSKGQNEPRTRRTVRYNHLRERWLCLQCGNLHHEMIGATSNLAKHSARHAASAKQIDGTVGPAPGPAPALASSPGRASTSASVADITSASAPIASPAPPSAPAPAVTPNLAPNPAFVQGPASARTSAPATATAVVSASAPTGSLTAITAPAPAPAPAPTPAPTPAPAPESSSASASTGGLPAISAREPAPAPAPAPASASGTAPASTPAQEPASALGPTAPAPDPSSAPTQASAPGLGPDHTLASDPALQALLALGPAVLVAPAPAPAPGP
ncbi:hypothetical protein V8E36_009353 [Tilletia maclaganii]